jgi:hypothetical protein
MSGIDPGCVKTQKLKIFMGRVTFPGPRESHSGRFERPIFLSSGFLHVFIQPSSKPASQLPADFSQQRTLSATIIRYVVKSVPAHFYKIRQIRRPLVHA